MVLLRILGASVGVSSVLLVTGAALAQTVKADHTTVDASAIPAADREAARALRMSFSHASVGGNIWEGLAALATDEAFAFPNWTENPRGNPGWAAKITDFEAWVADHSDQNDVFQNKFCYIDQDADFATYRDSMVSLEATYPTKTFVWWTMPLETTGANNALRAAFNQAVRAYCAEHDRPLYDIADVESHTVDGTAVTESGNEALDPAQSSDGGHLNELGAARAAAAQWALMAQLAGWEGGGTGSGGTGGGGTGDGGTTAGGGTPSAGGTGQTTGGSTSDAGSAAEEPASSSGDDKGCSVVAPAPAALGWNSLLLLASGAVLLNRRRRVTARNG